jgi:hypothetical protein
MGGCKWGLTARIAGTFAIAGACWATAGCGALIGLDPGDPLVTHDPPTPATSDDPGVSASPADSQDPPMTDAASEASAPQADAGTVMTGSDASDDDVQAPAAVVVATGAQDAMAASTVPPAMTGSGPGPGGDVDASTACPKGDQGGDGSGPGKGPGPGCKS